MAPRPTAPAAPYPNAGQATLLVVIALLLQVAAGGTAYAIVSIWPNAPSVTPAIIFNPWLLLSIIVISVCLTLALGLRVTREPVRQFLQIHPFAPGLIPAMIVTSLGVSLLLHEIDNQILHLLSLISGPEKLPADLLDIAAAPAGSFAVAVLAAPVLEEYLFRGLILRGLLAHGPRIQAILFSAILFGIVHANLRQFVIGLVLGLVFGWWYERTRSVGPGMVGHAVVNSVTWAAALLPNAAASVGLFRPAGTVVHEPWWLFVGGLAMIALGIRSFNRHALNIEPASSWPQSYRCMDEPPVLEQPPLLEDPAAAARPIDPPPFDPPPLASPTLD